MTEPAELRDDALPPMADYRDPAPFFHHSHGVDLGFYPAGHDRLHILLQLIGEARQSLKLAFYIFAMDEAGRKLRDALAQAAERGVSVTLILDDFGSDAHDGFFAPLIQAGGRVQRFGRRWNARYLIRNHQKLVIVDGERAMIGGFNITNAYFDPPQVNGWNDLGVTIRGGAVVHELADWFALLQQWTAGKKISVRRVRRQARGWGDGCGPVRWLVGGPSERLSPWARCVIDEIGKARRLDMMMAYFSPRRGLVRRIGAVARRGAARLLLAAKSDNQATIGASRALYTKLMRDGVSIHEFEPCKLHTKLIVIDDAVYLGSANFDMRSLYLNLELMLRVEDAQLAEKMRQFIADHLPYSTRITPQLHSRRKTLANRIRWTLSWFLVTVVDYTVTRRLNLGLKAPASPPADQGGA
ncbi:cardiolipin synthase [Altererythrobacter atlanticus]|uniref:Phospholipase D n=1 Tax=Croceibacterium atlanticum TaxID=1267766 RepID=A0A0F7KQG3_9SPHN|nr:phosphatidylserine/phosphatidylglycerophosphate/cardiolipin synthase family protein [Croceibacterium atlanticum]AKH42763.1 Major cardiolipin synthase ClsA [Croceibacterium atlanticum]MBB5731544.1 cardiolipin synthase [Croceibacterium atlanticum]